MPREWHDWHSIKRMENVECRQLYMRIVADKKPYFMRYIYPALMRQYNTYVKNTNKTAMREFQMTVNDMLELPHYELTDRQRGFLQCYRNHMPISDNSCVMNRICHRFEDEFDGYLSRHNSNTNFDYTIMKSGAEYSKSQFNAVLKLYNAYNKRLRSYAIFANYEWVDEYDAFVKMMEMRAEFIQECTRVCVNRFVLCDIVLDICYKKSSTKRFAWDMCGDEIIHNLLGKNNNIISYPTLDENGDIQFCGNRFSMSQKEVGGDI